MGREVMKLTSAEKGLERKHLQVEAAIQCKLTMGTLALSLHRESTDSDIISIITK